MNTIPAYRATGYVAPKSRYVLPVLFSPYTGEPRDARDIQSDPQGVLIWPPGAELLSAPSIGTSGDQAPSVSREDFDHMSAQLTKAKNLLVRIYDRQTKGGDLSTVTREMIELGTGNWFVWGVDRDRGPDAPSITDAAPQLVERKAQSVSYNGAAHG